MIVKYHIVPLLLFAVVLFSPLHTAHSQETIASDRPAFNSGSYVLGVGTVQLESGLGFSSSGPADQYGFGQILIRIGIPTIEVQALLNSFVVQRSFGSNEGIQDPGVGVKVRLLNIPEQNLAVSLLGTLSIPAGSSFLTSDEWIPTATLLTDYALSSQVAVTTNIGYAIGSGGVDDVLIITIHPGFTLPVEANAGVYVGYAGFLASSANQHFIEGGFTFFPTPDVQLDINGGVEVDTRDYFFGIGLATRWFVR